MIEHWNERDLSTRKVHEHELTSSGGEFMRVASDDMTVAIVWSTELSLQALLRTVSRGAKASDRFDAVVTWDEKDAELIPAKKAIQLLNEDSEGVFAAEIPFENFSLSWTRARALQMTRSFAAAAISYARDDLRGLDSGTAFLRTTGTPMVEHAESVVRKTLHEFEVI